MRRLLRWLGRSALALTLIFALFLMPVVYTEVVCRSDVVDTTYKPIVASEWVRPESNTLMTYPEWHIVHAYDDYAKVIEKADPHDFGYLKSIGGFWSSLCSLSRSAGRHGGSDGATKTMVYVIGVSFSVELVLKAAYEETIGRLFAGLGGNKRSPLEDLSATQAKDYASFLHQIPWYRWDFQKDKIDLINQNSGSIRDKERRIALGIEYGAKSAYAGVIAKAVASTGQAVLRMRSVTTGIDATVLASMDGIDVIRSSEQGIVIETPRYREFTMIAHAVAQAGGDFVEIAGNDDILFTAITDEKNLDGPLAVMDRQGYTDMRALFLLPVSELAQQIRSASVRIEHIHDY
jgi:hypothetical protein